MIKRVTIPFLATMAVLTLFVYWRAARISTNLVEHEYWEQMDRVAEMLGKHPYLLKPVIHSQLEELIGVRIGYYSAQGIPLDRLQSARISDTSSSSWPVLSENTLKSIAENETPFLLPSKNPDSGSVIMLTTISREEGPDLILALRIPTGPQRELRNNLFLALAVNGGSGLLVILVLTLSFSKVFSRKVHGLLTTMEEVAEGRLRQKVHEKGFPEWNRLAIAFNRMVQRLEQYQERLRASERLAAVGELSAMLAHEIRNPLTSLKMLGQVLRTRYAREPTTVGLIDPMLEEVDRIDRLVQSILDWSRPAPPQLASNDLNGIVSDLLPLIQPVLGHANIEVRWRPGEIACVNVDQSQLKQVIWNLIKNAENVSSSGDSITVTTTMHDNGMVQLTIEDQGPGLTDKEMENIFQPFYTTKTKGLGLGLTICKRIVDEHGGSLVLENTGCGVRAVLNLPAL